MDSVYPRIASMQSDRSMNPLSSFLFTCTFRGQDGDKLFSSSVLKKLNYSVKSVKIPKMKPDGEVKAISYGSFFVSFPFFSTGEKEMTISFYETDDMMISKILYELQARKRWKAVSLYSESNADLFVDVVIHDQRNTLRYDQTEVFRNSYSLILETFDPPKFSRTGTVQALTLEAKFNTIEGQFGSERWRKQVDISSDFDTEREMNLRVEEGGLDRDPDAAAIDREEIDTRWKKYEEEMNKIFPETTENAEVQAELDSQMRTDNKTLKRLSESMGANPVERGKYITEHPEAIKELRNTLIEQKVDVSDFSKVSDALYDMGLISSHSTGYCERWTEIIDSIVEGTPRIHAESAQTSETGWRERGYLSSASKKIKNKSEGDTFVWNEIKAGRVSEGDKILIYYADKPGEKAYGHIVTVLHSEEGHGKRQEGWGFVSDFVQATPTGLTDQPVTEIKILRKLDRSYTADEKALLKPRPGKE